MGGVCSHVGTKGSSIVISPKLISETAAAAKSVGRIMALLLLDRKVLPAIKRAPTVIATQFFFHMEPETVVDEVLTRVIFSVVSVVSV